MAAQPMSYNYLGNTGLRVSAICLGTMTFASETNSAAMPGTSREDAHRMLDLFAQAGGNFIDTADMYTEGQSEMIVGEWLKDKKRSDFVIATKARWPTGDGPNDQGLSRTHLMAALQESLDRLQMSYIDLYYLHAWDAGTPLKETLVTLNDMVRSGKVRYIGVANFAGWQLQKAIDLCDKYNLEPISCIQQQYSLLCRETEWEIQPCVDENKLALLPWSPLKGGWLTGRYKPNKPVPAEGRVAWAEKVHWSPTSYTENATPRTWKVLEVLETVAESIGKSPAQVALRWLLQKPNVPSIPIGARNLDQLASNLQATTFTLTQEEMTLLDSVSHIGYPYPYNLEIKYGSNRKRE